MLSKVALIGLSGSDKIVKLIFCPARTLVISPSAICILLVMLPKLAICTTVGEVWLALIVCPCSTTKATTVPSTGAVMRV